MTDAELRDAELRDIVLDQADAGLGVTTDEGEVVWVNAALGRFLGVPPNKAVGRSLPALLPGVPDQPERRVTVRGPTDGEGHGRWLDVSCRLVTDRPADADQASALLLYQVLEVTTWRERELEVTKREQALRRAQVLGRMGSWEWYLAEDRVVWSDSLLDMVGLPHGTELDYPTYSSLVHPEDLSTVERAISEALREQTAFSFTHRMFSADRSTEMVFECYGEVAAGPSGEPVRVLGTAHDVTRTHRSLAELVRLAEEDPLTGLANRRALTRALEHELANGRDGGALLLLDVDNFKDVNDLRGHAAGDQVMRALGAALRQHLIEGQVLGRLGGDEFAIVLPRCTPSEALSIGRMLCDAVSRAPVHTSSGMLKVTVSMGVAPFSSGAGWEAMLVNADLALYASKEAGRNRVTLFDPEQYADTVRRVSVLSRVRTALDDGALTLVAMPIVDIGNGRTVSHELLVRLSDGNEPSLSPAEFLPAVERTDLILELDRWVVGRAVDLLAEMPRTAANAAANGADGPTVEVNVSGRTLEDADFAGFVLDRLRSAGVAPRRLGLEITETAALTNLDAAQHLAVALRSAGCRMTLDDFGAGFGCFVHIKHLPITGLKIDGEFVRAIDTGADDPVFVGSIMHMAKGLGLSVVAEWVERASQVEALAKLGVRLGQGFRLGRPISTTQLVASQTAPMLTRVATRR